jgi:CheY-like chemotaxis protein
MKFVLHEYVVQDEYFFSVDTHDEMFKGNETEIREIAGIREFNGWVKRHIEELWSDRDLPTTASMNVLIQEGYLMRREATKNMTILVVDDDRHIGDTIQLVLEAKGFTVERLFDGLDAVEEVDPERHDLVVMDNQMTEMDGLEALKRLKADPRRRTVPIIITTTQNLDFTRLELADAYLHKPFHADALMSFVNLLLGGR